MVNDGRLRLLDAAAAADMFDCEASGFSADASVRITLINNDVPSYLESLEHLLRHCARPLFATERRSMIHRERRQATRGRDRQACHSPDEPPGIDIRSLGSVSDARHRNRRAGRTGTRSAPR